MGKFSDPPIVLNKESWSTRYLIVYHASDSDEAELRIHVFVLQHYHSVESAPTCSSRYLYFNKVYRVIFLGVVVVGVQCEYLSFYFEFVAVNSDCSQVNLTFSLILRFSFNKDLFDTVALAFFLCRFQAVILINGGVFLKDALVVTQTILQP